MAFPTIVFNSSGSDTLASGAGPGTALNGSLAATHTNTTVNITDVVDLSGVAVDGSAALWVPTSSGRRWARITAISGTSGNWTVTVAEAYATSQSGLTWAIGGKRQTLDASTQCGLDVRGGWIIDIQTDQTVTTNFRLTPNAVAGSPFTITSTVGTRATKITTSTNSIVGLDLGGAANLIISNLYFYCTAGTPGSGITCQTASACTNVIIRDCLVDGWIQGIRLGDSGVNARMQSTLIQGVEIKNCTQCAIWNQISGAPALVDCYIHDNGSASSGATVYPALGNGTSASVGFSTIFCRRCIFASNYGPAFNGSVVDPGSSSSVVSNITFLDCVFYKNNRLGGATAGVMGDIRLTQSAQAPIHIENNVFYGSAAGNFATQLITGSVSLFLGYNNAYGVYTVNFSGTGLSSGTNAVTLSADPFTSSTDFALNSTAGGGAACKTAGLQGIPNATASTNKPSIGAIQDVVTAAAPYHGAMAGGLLC